ncbi:MAG: ATP-binding protein, partial [Candidatus Moranbacteria bacterium]|nr:ATP-binding protein [Candidatus Moranbacteria bacterium]
DEILRQELLTQYFHDILTKNIVERYKLKDLHKLKNLALFYASNFTRKYSFHKIKDVAEFALSLDSIQRFSRYLESSFLIETLARFSYSIKNQMQTDRKFYFIDNGLHNAVAFKFSMDQGKLLENAVFRHLKRSGADIYYYAEKKEVDFVCKTGLEVTSLINVCYSLADKETYVREVSALIEGMKYFNKKTSVIITGKGNKEEIARDGFRIDVVPFYQWALSPAKTK